MFKYGASKFRVTIYTDNAKFQISGAVGDPNPDILSITTNKSIGNPAGTFSIVFTPKKDGNGLTWADKLDAFDYVEIEFQGIDDPPIFRSVQGGVELIPNIVMRGLIDTVTKDESWDAGVPRRQITISGRDLGALLSDQQIYYIVEIDPGAALLKDVIPLGAYGLVSDRPPVANADGIFSFIAQHFKQAIKLRLGIPGNVESGEGPTSVNIGDKLQYIAYSMFPDEVSNTFFLRGHEGNYWTAFSHYEDKPFHEMFVYDAPECSWFLLRPSRLKDAQGNLPKVVNDLSQKELTFDTSGGGARKFTGNTVYPAGIEISPVDKLSIDVSKSNSEIYNYFITIPELSVVSKIQFRGLMLSPYRTHPENSENPFFQTDENFPGFIGKFGFRKYEAATVFVDLDEGQQNSVGESYENVAQKRFVERGIQRNRTLVAWFMHNEKLLSGSMTIRGTRNAIIGTYLIDNDPDVQSAGQVAQNLGLGSGGGFEYYIEGVTHNFVVLDSYITTLSITRGMPVNGLGPKANKYFFGGQGSGNVYKSIWTPEVIRTIHEEKRGH